MTHKTIGILGGGQLGMMSAEAAKALGIHTIIYTNKDGCASRVTDETIIAPYEDQAALTTFANKVDAITYEFENIPVPTIQFLKTIKPVYPDDNLLTITQDRVQEKSFLNSLGIHTAQWLEIKSSNDIKQAFDTWNTDSLILKTTRFGYDGKGQLKLHKTDDPQKAWDTLNSDTLIAESIVNFTAEASIIVARDKNGHMVHYGPMLNHHKNHILSETHYPASLSEDLTTKAVQMTRNLAQHINLRGVICLELFVTADNKILANEIAPRTHNSGHWTIDATNASQFENHIRAVCGLPIIEPNPRPARMINLIGNDIKKTDAYKRQENTCVHDYGKQNIKQGRKMGHVTILEN